MYSCTIPKEIKTNKEGYEAIASIYHAIMNQHDKFIQIDFSECIRFDANLSAAFGAILDSHYSCTSFSSFTLV